ncbi:glycosyltransferase [Flavobacterium taihuense]|uniref:Glycosyltransferase n=1 Tax=Flavobacterium taihuense TaxID=2857508 RepID=A0ABS6XUK8_9FLAO|nr:glycosyltransferase [Flavobacterium taihuense]MBW4360368.1 glycosyltransferase [Flavobacterium taihuense]
MSPKSIIFQTSSFPIASETFIVSNIIASIEKGYDVVIMTKTKNKIGDSSQAELLCKYKLLEKTVVLKQPTKKYKRLLFGFFCMLHPIILFYFIKHCWQNGTWKFNLLYKLHHYLPYRKADVFHVHFAVAADELPVLKQMGFLKSKLLVTFHGYDAFFRDNFEQELLKNRYSLLFQFADRITVNTPFLLNKVLALGCLLSKLAIVPVGVNLEFFSPKNYPKQIISGQELQLVSVGRVVDLKGHEYGIRAVKLLVHSGYSVFYTIIGEGVLLEKLKLLVKNLQLESYVAFFGKGSQEEIREVYENSHIFLMTSIMDATGREEAQGIVTAEAQSMGLPIVGFESGGVPFTISERTGILVAQKDIVSLANNIEKLIKNNKKYVQMSNDARIWVTENFDISNMINSYYSGII